MTRLFWIVIFVLIVFLTLMIIDQFKKYKVDEISHNIQKRTTKTVDGGEEYFIHNWVWQRNKRKVIVRELSDLTFDKMCYPKNKWRKKRVSKNAIQA